MIVAEQKPLEEIKAMLNGAHKVLVVGCGTCVTVCFAGGAKEAAILAASLRMATRLDGAPKEVSDVTVQRQCEWEYLDAIRDRIGEVDAVLSLGCGVGVQALAERFPEARVLPGLNTLFMGLPLEPGVWAERCAGCGDCILDETFGICPIARCAKQLLNGPCGGVQIVDGRARCELSQETDCAWALSLSAPCVRGNWRSYCKFVPPRTGPLRAMAASATLCAKTCACRSIGRTMDGRRRATSARSLKTAHPPSLRCHHDGKQRLQIRFQSGTRAPRRILRRHRRIGATQER